MRDDVPSRWLDRAVRAGGTEVPAEAFGPEVGGHARVAVGVAALPFNVPVAIEAKVELA